MKNSQDTTRKPSADEIADQASNRQSDDILRELLRGDETKGDPDERDNAGGPAYRDTPHGREETKNDSRGKENKNG